MFYVKFTGETPYPRTEYEGYMIFDADTSKEYIKNYSRECAIQNATNYSWRFEQDPNNMQLSAEEYNQRYQDYISQCIDLASFKFLTESEFNKTLDHL